MRLALVASVSLASMGCSSEPTQPPPIDESVLLDSAFVPKDLSVDPCLPSTPPGQLFEVFCPSQTLGTYCYAEFPTPGF